MVQSVRKPITTFGTVLRRIENKKQTKWKKREFLEPIYYHIYFGAVCFSNCISLQPRNELATQIETWHKIWRCSFNGTFQSACMAKIAAAAAVAREAHNDDIVSSVSWKNDIEAWLQVEQCIRYPDKNTHIPTQRVMLSNAKKNRSLTHDSTKCQVEVISSFKCSLKWIIKKTSCSQSQHESRSIFLLISAHKKGATEISQCLVQLSLNEHYVLFIFSLFAWVCFFSRSLPLSVSSSFSIYLSIWVSEWVSVSCGVTAFRMRKFTMSLHFHGAFNFVFFAWFLLPTNVYEMPSLCVCDGSQRTRQPQV